VVGFDFEVGLGCVVCLVNGIELGCGLTLGCGMDLGVEEEDCGVTLGCGVGAEVELDCGIDLVVKEEGGCWEDDCCGGGAWRVGMRRSGG